MLAAVYEKYGPPSTIEFKKVPIPTLSEGDVLIKVYATTVNRTDCGYLRGKPFIVRFFSGLFSPKYKILGDEFAGVITKIGSTVKEFKVGERVFGYVPGDRFGAHAEYLAISADGPLATIPQNKTFEEIAPSTEGAHYALNYIRATKVKKGQKVLLIGATGAIGSSALQILKSMGVYVTAIANTKNLKLIKKLGADKLYNWENEDFKVSKERYDLVFDAVGKSSFGESKHLLKKRGIYVSSELGPRNENPFLALATATFGSIPGTSGKKVLFPIPTISKKDVEFLKALIMKGKFTPVIDKVYPFNKLKDAYQYVETGQKTGNVVIIL